MSIRVFAEYVWVDAFGGLRSKNRVLEVESGLCDNVNDYLPYISKWNFDGSSTGQAPTMDSEILLYPVRCFKDVFAPSDSSKSNDTKDVNLLVLCDTYKENGEPCSTNTRYLAKQIFDKKLDQTPWYGLEQEFFIIDCKNSRPLGFPDPPAVPRPQGPYYCSVGAENAFGRSLVNEGYRKCAEAGINVSGMNGEVAPGQWEIQVGPVEGISVGDEIWMLRYILARVSEKWSEMNGVTVKIDFGSKPVVDREDSWNGSGMHVNFSTKAMRKDGGYIVILDAIKKLKYKHQEHLDVYGEDNKHRLTGKNETSDPMKFTYSVGGRASSVRIPTAVHEQRKGYFEDRRPSSSCDPYVVTSKIFETCCL